MAGTCKDCLYYTKPPQASGIHGDTGLCTRFPPVPLVIMVETGKLTPPAQAVQGFTATTHQNAWCGEYSPGAAHVSPILTN